LSGIFLTSNNIGCKYIGNKSESRIFLARERKLNSTLLESKNIEKSMRLILILPTLLLNFITDSITFVEHARTEFQFNHGETINVRALK